jgi:large subunit ribosomal protein L22
MEVKAKLSNLRISPRKVRQVINLVRGKRAEEAQALLGFLPNKPARMVLKLLNSAVSSAKHDFQLELSNLYISKILANEGQKLKRFRPVSRGSAHPLWKRTSHIVLVLEEVKPTAKKKAAKKKAQISKEALPEPAKIEKIEEIAKEADLSKEKPSFVPKGTPATEGKERPKFERRETMKQKGPSMLRRVFRRKAM